MAAHEEGWLIFIFFQTSDRGWPACGRLRRQTSARTKTSARLKITFVDMTYPKGWTGSLPLCPLIFSWSHPVAFRILMHFDNSYICALLTSSKLKFFGRCEIFFYPWDTGMILVVLHWWYANAEKVCIKCICYLISVLNDRHDVCVLKELNWLGHATWTWTWTV